MTRGASPDGFYDREFDPAQSSVPLEIATLAQLQARVGAELMQRPGRVYFHVVVLCTGGEGLHEVDFAPVTLEPGRVVHVQPGQVHRWRLGRTYDATVLFFRDEDGGNIGSSGWPVGPRWFDLTPEERSRSLQLIDVTLDEYRLARPPASRDRALRGALQMLVVNLGLDQAHLNGSGSQLPTPYLALMDQLEADRHWSRSVTGRADRLGYSPRTLSRACQAAVGRTAKEVIDDRITLEARRLLVDPNTTVQAVARTLSFTEASNFAKFFHRTTGENPDAWRLRHLGNPGSQSPAISSRRLR